MLCDPQAFLLFPLAQKNYYILYIHRIISLLCCCFRLRLLTLSHSHRPFPIKKGRRITNINRAPTIFQTSPSLSFPGVAFLTFSTFPAAYLCQLCRGKRTYCTHKVYYYMMCGDRVKGGLLIRRKTKRKFLENETR